jgi:glyoxylase-like metal-dependent hydrolase (beta-lactamase superfamily II)
VRVVLVTHAHADHAGLAARWAAEGARVLGGGADLEALQAGAEGYAATRAARAAELRRHGCPEEILAAIATRPRGALAWPGSADVEAAEGATFDLDDGGRLRVIAAPGHTPGNLVVAVEGGSDGLALCSGDTLLPETIPTPGLHFPHGPDGPRWPSLPPFLDSVTTLRGLEVARVLPGHGAPVEGRAAVTQLHTRFLAHHARRASRVRAALAGGPATAFEVARVLFPRLPAARLGQALTEVIGHFDLLVASGHGVPEEGRGGVLGLRLDEDGGGIR